MVVKILSSHHHTHRDSISHTLTGHPRDDIRDGEILALDSEDSLHSFAFAARDTQDTRFPHLSFQLFRSSTRFPTCTNCEKLFFRSKCTCAAQWLSSSPLCHRGPTKGEEEEGLVATIAVVQPGSEASASPLPSFYRIARRRRRKRGAGTDGAHTQTLSSQTGRSIKKPIMINGL